MPRPVIALGDVTLLTPEVWTQVVQSTETVFIDWSDLELWALLDQVSPMKRRQYWQLSSGPFDGFEAVSHAFADSLAALRGPHTWCLVEAAPVLNWLVTLWYCFI